MSVLVRAAITADEWKRIRKDAIDAGKPVSEHVAALLRKAMVKDGAK